MHLQSKYDDLKKGLSSLGRVLVCFSGGVDSTLLLKIAFDELGRDNVLALIAQSKTYPRHECDAAIALAEQLGVSYELVESDELDDEDYLANTKNRCYYCKRHLFEIALKVAVSHCIAHVLEGSNVDDQSDYRPGRKAGIEAGIVSPLLDAGLTKADIRQLSEQLGLSTYKKPSMACLASRIPYGTRIDQGILEQIEKSEFFLKELGIRQLRVRYHGNVARIEVAEDDVNTVIERKSHIVETLKGMGFIYVTLDLAGYRTGSMNDIL
jgi:pyridinium-3,5-biscarboxylic acid mononucleotide sulfurtransferase